MENLNNLPPFYEFQKIVCIDGIHEPFTPDVPIGNDPKLHGIYIVKYCSFEDGCWWVALKGYSYLYEAKGFAPLSEQKFPLIKLTKIIEKELVSAN